MNSSSMKVEQGLSPWSVLVAVAILAAAPWALAGQAHEHAQHQDHAQHKDHSQHEGHSQQQGEAQPAAAWTRAEVRKLDLEQGRVTLRHERIESLDMAPMTMVFRLGEGVSTEGLAEGTQVRFQVTRDTGRLILTALEPVSND